MPTRFIPASLKEAKELGFETFDVILITGDAYVDHPSFGISVIGRYLESLGAKVGIIAAPDINNSDDFTKLGAPNWFFGVTAGNLDSMIMRTTASKKPRSDDAYMEGGKAGLRPKRAVIAYCNKLRELFDNPPILIGGLEASLRRFAHYDYWDDKVRRSILLDSRADILVYGMGERPIKEIVEAVKDGANLKELRGIRGTAIAINVDERKEIGDGATTIPSHEEGIKSKVKYARASRIIHLGQNPYSARALVQKHGNRYVLVNPPALPFSENEMDEIYNLPFTRLPHPVYKLKIPAYEMIRFSITAMRGCFGGCSFCALTVHQGKGIQSRSKESIVSEVKKIADMKSFTGYISDIGGPTANMYKMRCMDMKAESVCRRPSCVYPNICKVLGTEHGPQLEMLKEARKVPGVKKVFIASGVRYDLANLSPEYIKELASHHVSGQLKVAPEHSDPETLRAMKKPPIEEYDRFHEKFSEESKKAGLEQYIVPYFISSHPGCDMGEQAELGIYLKEHRLRPRQVQDFIPAPMTLAGDMYYTGIDPTTGREVYVEKTAGGRKLQRALMQYFKPENEKDVRNALKQAGRTDLIGYGKGKLVHPPNDGKRKPAGAKKRFKNPKPSRKGYS